MPPDLEFEQVAAQERPLGFAMLFEAFGVGAELFQVASNRWNEYLLAGQALIGVRFVAQLSTTITRRSDYVAVCESC